MPDQVPAGVNLLILFKRACPAYLAITKEQILVKGLGLQGSEEKPIDLLKGLRPGPMAKLIPIEAVSGVNKLW